MTTALVTDDWRPVAGTRHLRRSLRDGHWAEIGPQDSLGWPWAIYKADPVTMCPLEVDSGIDISLAAVKDNVEHWNRNYRRHAIVIHLDSGLWYDCRLCRKFGFVPNDRSDLEATIARALDLHGACEAAWQRSER